MIIAESYTAAASIHETTGFAVAVTFNAHNPIPVANALRARFPELEVEAAEDNESAKRILGAVEATADVKANGGRVAVSEFDHTEEEITWNDVALTSDLHADIGISLRSTPRKKSRHCTTSLAPSHRKPRTLDRRLTGPLRCYHGDDFL